jgi:hypothetical protein
MIKRKTKINTALLASLIISSLLIATQTITQTIASNQNTQSYNLVSLTTKTYSDEVELNSAEEYSYQVRHKQKIYKVIFKKRLEYKIKRMDNTKLKKIIVKIDKYLEIFKEKENINENKRIKILAQLLALKEIIEEKINNSEEYSIDIDLEEILNV